jgi:hypothetical protein
VSKNYIDWIRRSNEIGKILSMDDAWFSTYETLWDNVDETNVYKICLVETAGRGKQIWGPSGFEYDGEELNVLWREFYVAAGDLLTELDRLAGIAMKFQTDVVLNPNLNTTGNVFAGFRAVPVSRSDSAINFLIYKEIMKSIITELWNEVPEECREPSKKITA